MHRHSFFLDDEALNWFDQDAIQTIEDQKIRILNFTGVKEWKVLIPLEELLKSRSNLNLPVINNNNKWKIRVQIVPKNRPHPPYPFNIIPVTGIHVGFSFGNNSTDSINHNQGFHPKFNTSITSLKPLPIQISQENCQLYLLHTFPNSFYVDIYHLHELYPEKFIKVWGEKDLEIPVGFSSPSSSSPLKWGIHMRYHQAVPENDQKTHITIEASQPMVLTIAQYYLISLTIIAAATANNLETRKIFRFII
ncbi:7444_t:CDS:2 [Diversispora eburnea]|uniref:Protein PBN1 n=1 Tax=Diversispora eburnea TaxID=1213867 RepID=A0A9N9AJ94_9GLOM|nr:7444_t:CDS:2 [Diversispora eburnea]